MALLDSNILKFNFKFRYNYIYIMYFIDSLNQRYSEFTKITEKLKKLN
jgi:hypothetical protein